MLKIFSFCIVIICLFTNSFAGDLEDILKEAKKYDEERNYEESMKWYLLAAKQNHPESQYKVGLFYYNGYHGALENYEEAFKWYLLAAEQNILKAQLKIGYMYHYGLGIEKDEEKALFWFLKAYNNIPEKNYYNNDYSLCTTYIHAIWRDKKEVIISLFENEVLLNSFLEVLVLYNRRDVNLSKWFRFHK